MSEIDLESYLAWLDARLNAARAIPPDILLPVSLIAVLLFAMFFVAWMRGRVELAPSNLRTQLSMRTSPNRAPPWRMK